MRFQKGFLSEFIYFIHFTTIYFVFVFIYQLLIVEYNLSFSIVYFLNIFTIFIFSYVVHSTFSDPSCFLKGLSALLHAERGQHNDLVALLSKCLYV